MVGSEAHGRIAGGALPKARQWLQFLEYHRAAFPGGAGWVECFNDTLLGLHHQIAICARRLRGNPPWDMQGTMTDDTAPLEDGARVLLAKIDGLSRRDVPIRWKTWHDSLIGACRQQVRLAREIDTLQRRGEIIVDVTVDRAARRLIEAG